MPQTGEIKLGREIGKSPNKAEGGAEIIER